MAKKLKPMTPHEARTIDEICSLRRDNISTPHGWILIDGDRVSLAQQQAGHEAEGTITLPRAEFKRMIDWYLRPQERE
jgi:hypothetical protein